jgi:apolipoprotein N-acyltransferase
MNFIKLIILFAVVALLVYGFSGLSGKDSVAFTFLSFGFSAVIAAFFWIMIVLLVALYLFASSSISIYPKMLFRKVHFLAGGILFSIFLYQTDSL